MTPEATPARPADDLLLDTIEHRLDLIRSQCAGHADEFSQRVWLHAAEAGAALSRLRSRVAARPLQGAWQPIETAPKDHESERPILTWDGDVHLTTRGFTAAMRRAGWFDERGFLIHPTHWMPLPASPSDGAGQ